MMPMAPTSVMAIPPSSKPKIGFSIDSIVGNHSLGVHTQECSLSSHSESPDRPSSTLSDYNYPLEFHSNDLPRDFRLQTDHSINHSSLRINRLHQIISSDFQKNLQNNFSPRSSPNCHDDNVMHKSNSMSSPVPVEYSVLQKNDATRNSTRTPSPIPPTAHSQPIQNKGPIIVPGIPAGLIRPLPVQPPNLREIKSLPPYLNPPEVVASPNPHFLAAQFQMAAAIAHGQAGQAFPSGAGLPQHHPQFSNSNMIRDSYPLYPWLLSRHGRIFPHRFPGNFLLQPFRKPKRVRTAFSPSQLLKLEHAFESNHYVVGAERKTLAQALNLTETQVKVWFQNRRTKHKRMQQEEDAKSGHGSNNGEQKNSNDNNNGSQASYDDESEDELIDMDDCSSDQEGDLVP